MQRTELMNIAENEDFTKAVFRLTQIFTDTLVKLAEEKDLLPEPFQLMQIVGLVTSGCTVRALSITEGCFDSELPENKGATKIDAYNQLIDYLLELTTECQNTACEEFMDKL